MNIIFILVKVTRVHSTITKRYFVVTKSNSSSFCEMILRRALDMVLEQRGHFWGVQGHRPCWGLGGEGPGKFLGI